MFIDIHSHVYRVKAKVPGTVEFQDPKELLACYDEMKLGFFACPYAGVSSYFDLIDAAVHHGLPFVEGFNRWELSTPDEEDAKRLREYADGRGVKFACMSCYADLSGECAEATLEQLKGYARVASILGAPYLHHTVVPEYEDPKKVLPRKAELMRRGAEFSEDLFDYAQTLGVTTVIEDQGFAVNGVAGFGKFLQMVDRPVGVVADFGNIVQSGETILPFLDAYGRQVVHVHLKDVTLLPGGKLEETPFGTGEVPIRAGLEILKEIGYAGAVTTEFTAESPEQMSAFLAKIQNWI